MPLAEELFVNSDKLPIRLYCSICLDVAESAIITQCDHLFCQKCIDQYRKANNTDICPNCREPMDPISPATNARNFLSQQMVYCCEVEQLRCGWIGMLLSPLNLCKDNYPIACVINIGKYSMWHTHKAKYCQKASKSDKKEAKNAIFSEIGIFSKDELNTMSVGRLKKILQEYIKLNYSKLSEKEIKETFNWKRYLEKSEYISAIIQFEELYGVSNQFNNHTPPRTDNNDNDNESKDEFPTTYDGLKKLKIRDLSQYLRSKNIDPSSSEYGCIEKSDLINLVLKTQQHFKDIINGQAYDPKLEKNPFSSPPPPAPSNNSNHNNAYNQMNDEDEVKESPTTYHFGTNHLRNSSANRVDLNNLFHGNLNYQQPPPSSAYSYTFNNQQHINNLNRNNLQNENQSHQQRMFNQSNNINIYNNFNNFNHSSQNPQQPQPPPPPPQYDHNHNYNHHQQQQQHQEQQHSMPMPNFPQWFGSMPPIPPMPTMPQMPQIAQMPNISNIYNNAMDAAFGRNSAFQQHNNSHQNNYNEHRL